MSQLRNLAMTDVASKKGGSGIFFGLFLALLLFLLVVGIRNYLFVKNGMLDPDFALIHEAYNFNLLTLPKVLLLLALAVGFLGFFIGLWRNLLFAVAGLYGFIAVDLYLLRIYVTDIEPERLKLHEIRLETPKLTEPIRLLHMSDLQAGSIGDYERSVFRQVTELKPDLIIYTGDFLQVVPPATFDEEFPKLLELFHSLTPRYGTYAVFGDTELELYRYRPETLEPLRILSSRTAEIPVAGGALSLHGLSLYQSRHADWGLRTIEDWLSKTDESIFRIALGHAPDYAMALSDRPIDLCLAGHTHGGQVRLPFIGPLVIDSEVPKEWSRGFRRIGVPYLNVSAGAGSNRFRGLPPIRFNCPTEITVIDLVPIRGIR